MSSWIKCDHADKSTWPPEGEAVMGELNQVRFGIWYAPIQVNGGEIRFAEELPYWDGEKWRMERPLWELPDLCSVERWRRYPSPIEDAVEVPRELTAENGAKAALMGEFSVTSIHQCPDCIGDDCEDCGGEGAYRFHAPVSWPTIKDIYKAAIAHFEGDAKR